MEGALFRNRVDNGVARLLSLSEGWHSTQTKCFPPRSIAQHGSQALR
jgi:hypothetical protein